MDAIMMEAALAVEAAEEKAAIDAELYKITMIKNNGHSAVRFTIPPPEEDRVTEISFAPQAMEIHDLPQQLEEDDEVIWYTLHEYQEMRTDVENQVCRFDLGEPSDESALGLETRTVDGKFERFKHKSTAAQVIFEEQERQSITRQFDPSKVAEVYRRSTKPSKSAALKRGKRLEREIKVQEKEILKRLQDDPIINSTKTSSRNSCITLDTETEAESAILDPGERMQPFSIRKEITDTFSHMWSLHGNIQDVSLVDNNKKGGRQVRRASISGSTDPLVNNKSNQQLHGASLSSSIHRRASIPPRKASHHHSLATSSATTTTKHPTTKPKKKRSPLTLFLHRTASAAFRDSKKSTGDNSGILANLQRSKGHNKKHSMPSEKASATKSSSTKPVRVPKSSKKERSI